MMKKLLTFALLFCGFLQVWAQNEEEEGIGDEELITWTDDEGVIWGFHEYCDDGAYIVKCSKNTGELTIPSTVYSGSTLLNVTGIEDQAFIDCSGLTSVIIPEGVKEIGSCAFQKCTGLTTMNLPDGLESIGEGAFYYCKQLRSVTIPSSIKYIWRDAFKGCNKLSTIYCYRQDISLFENQRDWDDDEDVYFSKYDATLYVPYGCTEAYKIAYVWKQFKTIVEIPATGPLNTIDGITYNFANDKAYVTQGDTPYSGNIVIPAEITYEGTTYPVRNISGRAFQGCTDLTGVTFPDGLTTISQYAFEGCTGLTSVTLPEGVTTIGKGAFQGCTGLTTVVIPSTVTSISNHAFDGCDNLTTVYCYLTTPLAINYDTFSNRTNATLYVPYGCSDTYKAASYWKQFKEIIEMEEVPSGINTVSTNRPDTDDSWFTLDGRKLNSQPTQKGIYIRGGKKVVQK